MDNLSVVVRALLTLMALGRASGNLEGPFLFWGPPHLDQYRRAALQTLDQDELISLYERQSAVVVFNNQDSGPLSGGKLPRLRRLMERKTVLLLSQDFLDVHPDYINNETQVFTLQGPNYERDAEITETFDRLEDIYGSGNVLAILGNSMSSDYADRDETRSRRAVDDEEEKKETEDRESETDKKEKNEKSEREKVQTEYALYNASTVAAPSLKALIYSSQWPVIRTDSEEIALRRPLTATVDVKPPKEGKQQITKVIITFLHDGYKISLHFRFTTSEGWWRSGGVEYHTPKGSSLLQAPAGRAAPSAVLGKSYHCSQPTVYTGTNATLTFYDIQMQPFMDSTAKFADAFDCVGFMTEPVWSGVLVSGFITLITFFAIGMIFDIKTNDRYENSKAKSLVITVTE